MADRMNSRERVRNAISREEPDRVPIHDGPRTSTVRRWQSEGLPENNEAPAKYRFVMDCVRRYGDYR